MLQFAALGSGSKGNAYVVRNADTVLLIDAGFTLKRLRAELAALSLSEQDISAILISHEHGDHTRGLGPLARACQAPVHLTYGTYRALRDTKFTRYQLGYANDGMYRVGSLEVTPFAVPHDASEPCQFLIASGSHRIAVCTDLGYATPAVKAALEGCDAAVLEFNYDAQMLANGPYPVALQERIRSRWGHLSNDEAASLVVGLPRLQCLALGHLSEKNNTPEHAEAAAKRAVGAHTRVHVLDQAQGSGWLEVIG